MDPMCWPGYMWRVKNCLPMSEISKKSPVAIGSTADPSIAGREILWHSSDFIYCEAYSQVRTYTIIMWLQFAYRIVTTINPTQRQNNRVFLSEKID